MKAKHFLSIVFLIVVIVSCKKDKTESDNGTDIGNNVSGSFTKFSLGEDNDFSGLGVVIYTDNSQQKGTFKQGVLKVPLSSNGNKTIRALQIGDNTPVLIGRTEGRDISLAYFYGKVGFRNPINGYIPIGTYAELQLINGDVSVRKYKLETDLDLMNEAWEPIEGGIYAENYRFVGEFDGDGHSIKNLKIFLAKNNVGLFSKAASSARIVHLTISSGSISGKDNVGAIVGDIYGNGVVTDCYNYASVEGNHHVGGIAGNVMASQISKCQNFADIKGGTYIGGIVGMGDRGYNISDCNNSGNIAGGKEEGDNIGGVLGGELSIYGKVNKCNNTGIIIGRNYIGGVRGGGTSLEVSNCCNRGSVTGTGNYIGGISVNGSLTSCYNEGNIIGGNYVAGLVASGNVSDSYNTGNISATGEYIGGLIGTGNAGGNSSSGICYNTGSISGKYFVGGITGKGGATNSYNTGIISGDSWTGGISGIGGSLANPIICCYNKGMVSGKNDYIGGIVGVIDIGSHLVGQVFCSYNTGDIFGVKYIGGIIGRIGKSDLEFKQCYNLGNVNGTGNSDYQGVLVKNMFSTNNIYAPGGIVIDNSLYNTLVFSATVWPSSYGWTVGNKTWKTLGGWNGGNPMYPKLWFEP